MTRTAYKTVKRAPGKKPMPPWTPEGWILVPAAPTEAWITRMHERTSYPRVKEAIEMILATAPKYGEPDA